MVHPRKIENVSKLTAKDRYSYFIRKVADFQTVWGLYNDGWATMESQGRKGIPFWPEPDFAKLCGTGNWVGYAPREIPLDDFLDKWVPGMLSDGIFAGIFPTLADNPFVVSAEELCADLKQELQQYE